MSAPRRIARSRPVRNTAPSPGPADDIDDQCPSFFGDFGGVIGGTVVENDDLGHVDAENVAGHAADDLGDRLFLVQRRDGDD